MKQPIILLGFGGDACSTSRYLNIDLAVWPIQLDEILCPWHLYFSTFPYRKELVSQTHVVPSTYNQILKSLQMEWGSCQCFKSTFWEKCCALIWASFFGELAEGRGNTSMTPIFICLDGKPMRIPWGILETRPLPQPILSLLLQRINKSPRRREY